MIQTIDNVALLPAYLAAGTAVLVLLADLLLARRGATLSVAVTGAAATAAGAAWLGAGAPRATFCGGRPPLAGGQIPPDCSYVADGRGALVAVLFALLTIGVLALSAPALQGGSGPGPGYPGGAIPAGEYCFLLACSMTGGIVLGYAGDLITLIVALETLTLPLFVLVGLRRRSVPSAEGAVTFFVVSVVATAVTLLGAALLYAVNGILHLDVLAAASAVESGPQVRLARVAVVLLLTGLAFKVAAVPMHAWAPVAYDGAPIPVAGYLSTASKLGGIVAILSVVVDALRPWLSVAGPALAVLAVLTMTVGNVVALRQTRMVRLLAWSSVAQAGYILAPLGAAASASGRTAAALSLAVAATLAYTVFYVVLELAAFGAVVALRPPGSDGGSIADYRGAARRRPWVGAALVLALIGLAGLPPGLAGLFAKVVVVRALLGGGAGWLAVVVALNAVVGLAYYVRASALLYKTPAIAPPDAAERLPRLPWPVAAALGAATLVALVVGFAPQLVLDAAQR